MKKLNNKGFTLIELLAVVVIMGILMIVAIPAVTKYINNSKKDVFADTAGTYINAARYSLLNGEYDCQVPSTEGEKIVIPLDIIDMDKGNGKSTYGYNYSADSFVQAKYVGGKLEYSICLTDTERNGTGEAYTTGFYKVILVKENDVSRKYIAIKNEAWTKCSDYKDSSDTVCKKN